MKKENKYICSCPKSKKIYQQMKKRVKGFTLIELLIVIAIIGILATIVMASLNSARSKGNDAAIKVDLAGVRTQSSIWYDDNGMVYAIMGGDYTMKACPTAPSAGNIFADPNIFSAISAAYTLSGGAANSECAAFANAWAVAVQLKTSDGPADGSGSGNPNPDAWCVDSAGSSRPYYYGAAESILSVINVDTCR